MAALNLGIWVSGKSTTWAPYAEELEELEVEGEDIIYLSKKNVGWMTVVPP